MLGLINFYGPFIPKYAEIVACLTELTAGPATYQVVTKHNEALVDIQKAMSSKPFFPIPILSFDFYEFTDLLTVAVS